MAVQDLLVRLQRTWRVEFDQGKSSGLRSAFGGVKEYNGVVTVGNRIAEIVTADPKVPHRDPSRDRTAQKLLHRLYAKAVVT
jgi:hypothetical protein